MRSSGVAVMMNFPQRLFHAARHPADTPIRLGKMVEVASSGGFSIAPTVRGTMRKARFVIPVVALGGLAIGSFMLLRRRRNQTA
jgi:hypothetical protein